MTLFRAGADAKTLIHSQLTAHNARLTTLHDPAPRHMLAMGQRIILNMLTKHRQIPSCMQRIPRPLVATELGSVAATRP